MTPKSLSERRLCITSVTWSRHQLVMRFALSSPRDTIELSTVYWYEGVDLLELDQRYGRDFMERIHVHSALFEINKIASLRPSVLDLGPYARHHTEALERLWRTIFEKVWAQWRYENDLPGERPPPWASQPVAKSAPAARRDRHAEEVLLFSGGGKDSLVSMKLLERGDVPFASFAYAATTYGLVEPQATLIDRLLDQGTPRRRERQIVIDDFFDAPLLALYGEELGVKTVTAAETPSSIFAALPILLSRGYPSLVLGNEASANHGNLVWDRTGEEVNHQWGKSVESMRLLDGYLRSELVEDAGVFSVLMPIHDAVIFELLRRDQASLPATHSCNVKKPWCLRCAKCAYVWLGLRAHLDREVVESTFAEDPLEIAENEGYYRDMMGLGAHTPFECIGRVEESRLALALCHARGLLGPRGRALAGSLPPIDLAATLDLVLSVDLERADLPEPVAAAVVPQMQAAARSARARIAALLG